MPMDNTHRWMAALLAACGLGLLGLVVTASMGGNTSSVAEVAPGRGAPPQAAPGAAAPSPAPAASADESPATRPPVAPPVTKTPATPVVAAATAHPDRVRIFEPFPGGLVKWSPSDLPVVEDSREGLNLFMLRMVELEDALRRADDALERGDYDRVPSRRIGLVGRLIIQADPYIGFDGFTVPRSGVAYLQTIAKAMQVRAEALEATSTPAAEIEFLQKHDYVGLRKRMIELRPR